MRRPPNYWLRGKKKLSKKDPVLRKIIKKYKKGFLTTRNNPFFSLCRTIVGQQISTKAADSIWLKFEKKCKNNINPKTILKIRTGVYEYNSNTPFLFRVNVYNHLRFACKFFILLV